MLSSGKKFFLLHCAICFFGLIGLTSAVARKLGFLIDQRLSAGIHYSDSFLLVSDHTKIGSILQYVLLIVVSLIYFIFLCWIEKKELVKDFFLLFKKYNAIAYVAIYFFLLAAVNIFIFKVLFSANKPSFFSILCAGLIWGLCFFHLFLRYFYEKKLFLSKKQLRIFLYGFLAVIVCIMMQCVYLFSDYLGFKPLKIANDYFSIPEKTLINNVSIDNQMYMKAHNIGGFSAKIPSIDHDYTDASVSLIKFHTLGVTASLVRVLCKHISTEQCNYLFINLYEDRINRSYSKDELSFIKKNKYELETQLIAGHYFHHQNALLAPLNAYVLGESPSKIVFLYGFGNTIFLAKLMSFFGGFNFQTMTHVLFSFYPLYYVLLLLVMWFVFRDVFLVAFVMLLSLSALQLIGFETIRYAPGNNPLRHFMDLFVLIGFFQYLRASYCRWLYLILSFSAALLAISADKEFGTMIFISLSMAFLLHFLVVKPKQNVFFLGVFLGACSIAVYIGSFLKTLGSDSLAIYGMLGVSVAPTSSLVSLLILLAICFLYGLFFIAYKVDQKSPYLYLGSFLFFYFQGLMVYFVWYTNPSHFLSAPAIPLIILFACFIKGALLRDKSGMISCVLLCINIGIVFLLYLPACYFYKTDERSYNRIFKTHYVYQWRFPRAQFLSTMNPAPFENAVTLITQYGKRDAIYMISRYDNFLPFLSGKYLAFPYAGLNLSVPSQAELDGVVSMIKQNRPQYIFVDSDIENNHFSDILGYNDPLNKMLGYDNEGFTMSIGRVLSLTTLQDVFHRIKDSYRLVARGDLIDVYERKK